jgi:hypothetical protein
MIRDIEIGPCSNDDGKFELYILMFDWVWNGPIAAQAGPLSSDEARAIARYLLSEADKLDELNANL